MNWDAIGAIAEILGAVSVLATLIYLAHQIKQSNKIATASSEISIRDNFGAINSAIYEDEAIAVLFVSAENPNHEFGKVERVRLRMILTQLVNVWHSIEVAYDNGMASEASYNNIFDDVNQVTTGSPALKPIFLELIDSFPSLGSSKLFTALRNASESDN